jgi:energy-converting hydrogenase B subunit D
VSAGVLVPALLAIVRPPAPTWAVTALQVTLLVLVGAGSLLVVLMRHLFRQVVLLSMYGVLLALLFLSVQAPDVALSELTVGAVALPLLLLLTLAKVRKGQE